MNETDNKKDVQTNEFPHKHNQFRRLLMFVDDGVPVILVGPTGSGKNVCVQQVANELGLDIYYTNRVTHPADLEGFLDVNSRYYETQFYKAFKNGGLFFLDEIDTCESSALIVMNSALSNGYFPFPNGVVYQHPNFRFVTAANTWGDGADNTYVGRIKLDGATLDRFAGIEFDYDKELEKLLCPDPDVLKFVWSARKTAKENGIRMTYSTRAIKYFYKLKQSKYANDPEFLQWIVSSLFVKGLSDEDKNLIVEGFIKEGMMPSSRPSRVARR